MFYGDETWLNMFPKGVFEKRSEGTTSFFVTDFTEVDNNVTRGLKPELASPDTWDVMILHYLGLDHVGHSLGGQSPEIGRKLAEMDSILHKISVVLVRECSEFDFLHFSLNTQAK